MMAGAKRSHGVAHDRREKLSDQDARPKRRLRCAVYTRKLTEEGLEQDFNSLHAQREACAAFIASQAGLGWRLVADPYDDGGISGATLERPALQRLLQDIRNRTVDVVVVYKIDRLTRSLADFATTRPPDPSLVDLVGRAHLYLRQLTQAPGVSIADLATRYTVHPADISRVLPLAFLAPNLTQAILRGRQPVDLAARQLARLDLPLIWSAQVATITA